MSGFQAATEGDARQSALCTWLRGVGYRIDDIRLASGDASFRRYFRVLSDDTSYIAMDAPPEHEDCYPFATVADLLASRDIHVPLVLAHNLNDGFLLLDDLGSRHYLDALDADNAQRLYGDALDCLFTLHSEVDHHLLPRYDDKLLYGEMQLFVDWYLLRHCGIKLERADREVLAQTFELLVDNALQQPRTFVHRDFHSRNLMVTEQRNPGVLDFQDAVSGPLTYDLVSLLRDCYIGWPQGQVATWAAGYHARLVDSGLCEADLETFARWFDLMGMQRHLKAIGIFTRLSYRDGKHGYMRDIPRTYQYIADLYPHYPELSRFAELMQRCAIGGGDLP